MMANTNGYAANLGGSRITSWEQILSSNVRDLRLGIDVHRITETLGRDSIGNEVSHIDLSVIHTFGDAA